MGLLTDLPSRGFLSSVAPGCALVSRPSTYICTHDTAPPASQVLKLEDDDQLARYYSSKQAAAAKAAATGKTTSTTKRAGPSLEAPSSKKAAGASGNGPSSSTAAAAKSKPTYTANQLKALTVKDLSDILRGLKLGLGGRKEELIRRILDYQLKQKRLAS